MKRKNMIIGLISIILTLIIVGLTWASFFFYNLSVKRSQKEFLQNNEDLSNDESVETANMDVNPFTVDWFDHQSYETWEITSEDGLKLKGYYIKAKSPTAKTVIIAHGYSSRARYMSSFAELFCDKLGYNVLMPDARGHGSSEGDYIGFGWPERKDYLQWIKMVIDVGGTDSQIALFGTSMGGATVMMVSGEDLPEQVKVIVEDCGYSSVFEELSYQVKRMYHLPSFPIVYTTSILTDLKVGYNFFEASSVKQVSKDKVPMLFIHGSKDTFVPTDMVYQVYNACKADKDILIVEGAGHGMAYFTDPATYEKKVSEFIKMYIK